LAEEQRTGVPRKISVWPCVLPSVKTINVPEAGVNGMTTIRAMPAVVLVLYVGASVAGCGDAQEATATSSQSLVVNFGSWDDPPCSGIATCTMSGVTMHCCQPGWAMRGAYFSANSFMCGQLMSDFQEHGCYLDSTTVRNNMKACPVGYYMKGHHAAQNKSICCQYMTGNQGTISRVDGDNETANAVFGAKCNGACPGFYCSGHACFSNEVMVGVHIGNNDFLCES